MQGGARSCILQLLIDNPLRISYLKACSVYFDGRIRRQTAPDVMN